MILKRIIFSFTVILIYSIMQTCATCDDSEEGCEEGESCSALIGESAVCVIDRDCEAVQRMIVARTSEKIKYCSFSVRNAIVCCPIKSIETTAAKYCKELLSREEFTDGRIIMGEDAEHFEFPGFAVIGYIDGESNNSAKFECGGTLISDKFVISAAHCANKLNFLPKFVRLGTVSLENNDGLLKAYNPESDVMIKKIILNPNYNKRSKYDDITLFELAETVDFHLNIYPACLSVADIDFGDLTIAGFGRTSLKDKTKRAKILQKATVKEVPFDKCHEIFKKNTTDSMRQGLSRGIIQSQICVHDKSDTCQGDSGGPLQYIDHVTNKTILVGITSFGIGCGAHFPSIYTRISKYIDWIESIVWPNS